MTPQPMTGDINTKAAEEKLDQLTAKAKALAATLEGATASGQIHATAERILRDFERGSISQERARALLMGCCGFTRDAAILIFEGQPKDPPHKAQGE